MREILKGGMGDKKRDSFFNRKELKLGIQIEKEHTANRNIAKEIAKDHLTEFPKYYSKGLIPLEKRLKKRYGKK
jgi:hypothetical protein